MSMKMTFHETCPHCGEPGAKKRTDGRIERVQCKCLSVPGPPSPPRSFSPDQVNFVADRKPELKRYECMGGSRKDCIISMVEHEEGIYIRHSDYESERAMRAKAEEETKELHEELNRAYKRLKRIADLDSELQSANREIERLLRDAIDFKTSTQSRTRAEFIREFMLNRATTGINMSDTLGIAIETWTESQKGEK